MRAWPLKLIRERTKQFIAPHSRHHLRQEQYAVVPHVRICVGAAGNRYPYRDPLELDLLRDFSDAWTHLQTLRRQAVDAVNAMKEA